MKALFILHEGYFIYGANRSVTGILQNVDYDYDLMICKSFTAKIDEKEIRKTLGRHLKKIMVVWMPRYRCQFYDRVSLYRECSHIVNNIMAFLAKGIRQRLIREGGYDYVHLNSLVLYPVIDENANYIVHAREVINPAYRGVGKLCRALERAAGVIYIDEATKAAIEKVAHPRRTIVLNNPFDMTKIAEIDYEESLRRYGLSADNTIFAMLGQVGDNKGSKLVIRAFMKHPNPASRLLIVGNHRHAYGRECEQMSKDDARIIYCGELKDTGSIYRVSDYIIRGDAQFCIGRTIYEGLFSGTGVIIPGKQSDLAYMQAGAELQDQIHFYEPRSEEALTGQILECSHHKRSNREWKSNIESYMQQYDRFVGRVADQKETL